MIFEAMGRELLEIEIGIFEKGNDSENWRHNGICVRCSFLPGYLEVIKKVRLSDELSQPRKFRGATPPRKPALVPKASSQPQNI